MTASEPVRRSLLTRGVRAIALCLVVGLVLGVAGLVGVFWWYGRGVQLVDEARLLSYRPPQITRVLARDGRLIGELYTQRRTVVPYGQIPSHVENAFLAAEDADFYRHDGMDYLGMVRALLANVVAGGVRQGASTITQQVVKVFLLTPERTIDRKVQELILARRVEQTLTKRQILHLYLNEIYFGEGCYGIEEASRRYFGRSVDALDLGQAAVLAALPKAPSRLSPVRHAEAAKRRQVYVLDQMVRHGFATKEDADRFAKAPMEVVERPPEVWSGADEFVDAARRHLSEKWGAAELDTLGATVTTTVDVELQRATKAGLDEGLVALDRRNGFGHKIRPAKEANLERARARGAGPLRPGEVYPVVLAAPEAGVTLPPDGVPGTIGTSTKVFVRVPPGSRYRDASLPLGEQFPPSGITMVKLREPGSSTSAPSLPAGWLEADVVSGPEAAVLLADVRTGEVLAMVGGSAYERGGWNRATDAKRQPGSSFKPFLYAAALASRRFTAASIMTDSPEVYETWRPTNFEEDRYLGDIRLRVALAQSVNTVAVKLLEVVGWRSVHDLARAVGFVSPLTEDLSLALGTSEVRPNELLAGFMTLARGGRYLAPRVIVSVERSDGPREDVAQEERVALPEDVAFVTTSLLTSVVREGTGKAALALGREVAGKTGTSAENRDAWFAGYTPRHVGVAWVGFDRPAPLGKNETGGKAALPLWLAAMQAAEARVPAESFRVPPEVSVRRIDPRTGGLARALAGAGTTVADEPIEEYFLVGTEPVDVAPLPVDDAEVLLDLYGDGGSGPEGGARGAGADTAGP